MMLFPFASGAQTPDQDKEISVAVESFRNAVINADGKVLAKLLSDDLSYGHSDGHVDGKKELVRKLSDGTYDFITMEFTAQTIKVTGNIAIVRNKLDGKTNDGGIPNEAHLYVLMVWQKSDDGWKLLARQTAKQKG